MRLHYPTGQGSGNQNLHVPGQPTLQPVKGDNYIKQPAMPGVFYSRSKTWSSGPGQSSMALPVKIANCFGVLDFMKSQAPSTKLQTNLKFQYQMTKTGFEF
jgi:hypothetical protein